MVSIPVAAILPLAMTPLLGGFTAVSHIPIQLPIWARRQTDVPDESMAAIDLAGCFYITAVTLDNARTQSH